MNTRHILSLLAISGLLATGNVAKAAPADTIRQASTPPVYRFYLGTSMEGLLFSGANINSPNNGTLRFTYFFNFGTTFNLNLNRHFGLFSGVDIKNVGFIEKVGGNTIKRRTYNIGVPLGIKIGNMAFRHPYLFLGGGLDFPINYKEKYYETAGRAHKHKFNEWFSDATPHVMPYVFAGVALRRGITLKAQYYPNNFLNPDFKKDGGKPYLGYDVQVYTFTLGMHVPTGKRHKHDIVNVKISNLKTSSAAQ